MASEALLRLQNISKAFNGVKAVDGAGFEVLPGEVHALAGENGAGKSTLMNIAGGVFAADDGEIFWEGRPVRFRNPREAQDSGISFVHQELALVPQLSAAENIFLGRHPGRGGWVGWEAIYRRGDELLRELGREIDSHRAVEELSIADRQLVEIARALACNARLIIMDEATAPLSEPETACLFEVIGRLKGRGVGVVYITHRLKEVYQIADRISVMRDGRHVATGSVSDVPPDLLVKYMVGRTMREQFPGSGSQAQAGEALRIEGFTSRGRFSDVGFHVSPGEILGLAGLVGAGRTEVMEAVFGAGEVDSGSAWIDGHRVTIRDPRDAIRHGIALVSDDRKGKGLVLGAPVRENMVLACQRQFLLDAPRERGMAERMIRELRVRTPDAEQPVGELSGGNQQKVVLARWLLADARIFLLDEPTRGIDVGAKAEIYELIRGLAGRGAAIVLATSEMEEMLYLADRIVVMHRGRVAGELSRSEASEERVMQLAAGVEQ